MACRRRLNASQRRAGRRTFPRGRHRPTRSLIAMSMTHRVVLQFDRAIAALEAMQPAAQLLARLYVAKVFLLSGLTKLHDWDTTLALFQDEYHVPLLSPTLAAWLGTGGELLLPLLLALGLAGRGAAIGLFVINAVAVISLGEVAEAA